MRAELEVALLGVAFGGLLMPALFVIAGRALDYLEGKHGIDAEEIADGE